MYTADAAHSDGSEDVIVICETNAYSGLTS